MSFVVEVLLEFISLKLLFFSMQEGLKKLGSTVSSKIKIWQSGNQVSLNVIYRTKSSE